MKSNKKLAFLSCGLIVFLIVMFNAIGINDLGYRTVVQWPTGKTFVKFDKGIYIQAFGSANVYPDVIVFDHDRSESEGGALLDQKGIGVRYQDGGMGAVFGKERFNLPTDESTMLTIHKEFHSPQGLANNLIKPVTEQAMNLTAGLMRSEEAYATKRGIFTSMAKEQIGKGRYITQVVKEVVIDVATGKSLKTDVPKILTKGGIRQHEPSDLKHYGITIASMQLNDPGFEPKTMEQISKKREANMAIITAKADAEKAKQDTITAEENGKADVMKAQYTEEVEKAKQVVIAERSKEVARIKAEQKVEVATQAKLEAVQFKLRAKEIKDANILEGEGLAEKKRLIMKADGALKQKLEALVVMNRDNANALAKRAVPSTYIAGTGSKGKSNSYDDEMVRQLQLLNINAMRTLNVETAVK